MSFSASVVSRGAFRSMRRRKTLYVLGDGGETGVTRGGALVTNPLSTSLLAAPPVAKQREANRAATRLGPRGQLRRREERPYPFENS